LTFSRSLLPDDQVFLFNIEIMNFRCRTFRSFVDGIQMCKTRDSQARSRRSDRTNTGLQPSNSLLLDRLKRSARPVRSGTSVTVPIQVRDRRRFSWKRSLYVSAVSAKFEGAFARYLGRSHHVEGKWHYAFSNFGFKDLFSTVSVCS